MSTDTADWLGSLLAGSRYHVRSKLGEGGMGIVYRAWDRNLETEVVVKVPRPDALAESDFAARFTREIRSLVKLAHPHIVRISDVGEHNGMPFAVMQYLPGGSLKDRQPMGMDGVVLPGAPERLQEWLGSVAKALDFIHVQGYVHRDVKPANILFDADGNAFLSDFGIAKVLADRDQSRRSSSLTGTGLVLGTPEYMAPELIMGEPFDGRIDQYSLAVTIYEVLTGRLPFEGPTASAILVRHTSQAPVALCQAVPSISQDLSGAVLRGLAKQPRQRFPDCRTLAATVMASLAPARVSTRVPTRAFANAPVEAGPQSSAVRLACPFCGQSSRIPVQLGGGLAHCTECKKRVYVSQDLTRLEYAVDEGPPASAEAATRRVPGTHQATRSAPSISGTQARKSRRVGTTIPKIADSSSVVRWCAAAVLASTVFVGGLVLFYPQLHPTETQTLADPADHRPVVNVQPPMPDSAKPADSSIKPADSSSELAETATEEGSGTLDVIRAAAPSKPASVKKVRPKNTASSTAATNTPSTPISAGGVERLSPHPTELIQRLTGSVPPSGPTRELMLCRDIARLAYGNLAIVAAASSNDQKCHEAIQSMDKMKEPREWTDVDQFFDEYAKAIRQTGEMLGREWAPSGSGLERHLYDSESYTAALIGHWRGQLGGAVSAEAGELAAELVRIEAEGTLEKLLAKNSLQAICQAHMDACRTLAAATAFRRSAPESEIRRMLADVLHQDYSDGLEQLRALLACELVLWSKLSASHP